MTPSPMITPMRMAQPCGKSFATAQSDAACTGLCSTVQLNAACTCSTVQIKPALSGSNALIAPTSVRATARAQSTTNSLFSWISLIAKRLFAGHEPNIPHIAIHYRISWKQREDAMGMMIIRHKVRDYGLWRPVFDRQAEKQRAAGLINPR